MQIWLGQWGWAVGKGAKASGVWEKVDGWTGEAKASGIVGEGGQVGCVVEGGGVGG